MNSFPVGQIEIANTNVANKNRRLPNESVSPISFRDHLNDLGPSETPVEEANTELAVVTEFVGIGLETVETVDPRLRISFFEDAVEIVDAPDFENFTHGNVGSDSTIDMSSSLGKLVESSFQSASNTATENTIVSHVTPSGQTTHSEIISSSPKHVVTQSAAIASSASNQVRIALKTEIASATNDQVQTIILDLHPAELGKLQIRVEQTPELLIAQIVASELVSSELLLHEKDFLLAALSDLGFGDASLDISHGGSDNDAEGESKQENLDGNSTPEVQGDSTTTTNAASGLNVVV